ncbi:response regulator [Chitinimonas koreensis]|uniref:response regulator n=1 Tax=Chitinimonas koreensis TaxID=356302 RepID=UPI000419617E|nr:response regulator [Chitinimonas koreensis]QNM96604.1 response regulator [Chitinimonas koreensis]
MNARADKPSPMILIVDDTPTNLGVMVDSLEAQGFRALVAQSGVEALERARYVSPDLILLDVMMPGMDGFEVCRRLKQDEATRSIPVIFMTALADTDNTVAGLQAGAVDYVTKPFKMPELLARIDTQLAVQAMQRQLQRRNAELHALNERLLLAQVQLEQADKLASIGQLAAGIAHEINNPISFVFANLGVLEDYVVQLFALIAAYEAAESRLGAPPQRAELARLRERIQLEFLKEDVPALLEQTLDGIGRVRQIVQDLRDFSHVDGNHDWQWADLHRGIDTTLNIIGRELKDKAELVKDYGPIPEVECLPSQLNQVVMNLATNAAQAIGAERGRIVIRTGVAGEQVWLEISDNGTGIPEENLPRIFDPFFTTKPIGKGTGLGLSLSYGIVQKHRGRIEVESVVGQGTTFRVMLPIRRAAADRG